MPTIVRAESFFATTELIHRTAWLTVFDFIDVWDKPRRRHSFISQVSPAEVERRYVQHSPPAA